MLDNTDDILELIKNIKNLEDTEVENFKNILEDIRRVEGLINTEKNNLWQSIRKLQEFLLKLRKIDKIDHSEFTFENINIRERNQLAELRERLDRLKIDIKKTKDRDNKVSLLNFSINPLTLLNIKEIREIEAENKAQIRCFDYINFYYHYYKMKINIKISYAYDCYRICNNFHNLLKMLNNTVEDKIIPELEEILLFFKSMEIVKLFEENKITEKTRLDYISLENIDITMLENSIYEEYFTFIKNTFTFYNTTKRLFTNNFLTELLEIKPQKRDVESVRKEIGIPFTPTKPSKLALDGTFGKWTEIDVKNEFAIYSIDDIEFLDYEVTLGRKADIIQRIEEQIEELTEENKNIEKSLYKINKNEE